jgi:hypothetical protein
MPINVNLLVESINAAIAAEAIVSLLNRFVINNPSCHNCTRIAETFEKEVE